MFLYRVLLKSNLIEIEERIGVITKLADGKWIGKLKRLPLGLICTEAKFHGDKDLVCLFSGPGKGLIVAYSLTDFEGEVSVGLERLGTTVMTTMSEEAKLERYIELTEGKKEKLRCGSRGYICLGGDERKLEVYEITDS